MNKYENYRVVELPWLKEIPAHWRISKVNNMFEERREKVSDKEYEALSVTKMGILKQLENVAKTNSGENRKKVIKNDFVINSRSDRKGSSGLSEFNGSVSLINIVLKVKRELPKYIHYLLKSVAFQEEFYRNGKGIVADLWSTNYQNMKNIYLPVPSFSEQQQIANYLDWKIGEIDKLIDIEKQKLEEMELYKKKFIDNSLKKKGKIKYRLKDIFTANDDYIKISSEENYIRYIEIGDVGTNKLKKKPATYRIKEAPSRAKRLVKENDIILSTVRTYLKSIIKIDNSIEDCVVSTGFVVLRPKNKFLNNNYLEYALMSDEFLDQVISNSIGISYPAISEERILALPICLPEDNDNAYELKKFELKFEKLLSNIEKMINNLTMLKKSLISEVVTGQLDVRNVKIPERK